jgi:1,2-phenylacetyl-CoA epoxidase PaaB subunit
MGWYILFKERNGTFTQTAKDKDQAVLEACELYVRRRHVLSIGPFGRDALRNHEIEGAELRDILRKLTNEGRQNNRGARG